MPDMAAAEGARDELALHCAHQMYVAMSRLPLWRLRTGRFVHLTEGCFLAPLSALSPAAHAASPPQPHASTAAEEGSGNGSARTSDSGSARHSGSGVAPSSKAGGPVLGPAAMQFMQRQLPLLDVPWRVKLGLDSAGVQGARVVSPPVVRPMLRSLVSARQPGAPPLSWAVTVTEAVELLRFCVSDIVVAVEEEVAAVDGGYDDSNIPTGVATVVAGSEDQAGGAGAGGSVFQDLLAPGSAASLLNAAAFNLQGLLTQVGRALEGVAAPDAGMPASSAAPAAGQRATATNSATAAAPGGNLSAAVTAGIPGPVRRRVRFDVDETRAKDLRGVPVPNAAGAIVPLGQAVLLALPPECGPSPASLLPPRAGQELLHPDVVRVLLEGGLLQRPEFRSWLGLRPYTCQDLSRHLSDTLPPAWHRPGLTSSASGWEIPGSTPLETPGPRVAAMGLAAFGRPPAAGAGAVARPGMQHGGRAGAGGGGGWAGSSCAQVARARGEAE